MKRFLLSFLVFAFSVAASAQFIPHAPAKGGYCLTHAGAWVPIWADQSASALPNGAPAGDLYGLNSNGTWYGLSCDDSGHLTTLPAMTCDASTVPNYAQALCVFTLTTADLLQFDGFYGTEIAVISTPGSGRTIVPNLNLSAANYIYKTTAFQILTGLQQGFSAAFGSNTLGDNWLISVDATTTYNTYGYGVLGYTGSLQTSSFGGLALSIFSLTPYNLGSITSSTLDFGGASGGVNTSQTTAGNAGLTYQVNDQPSLPCGAVFNVDSVDGVTGAVLTYHEIASGAGGGCTVGTGQAVTGGNGSGWELDVLTIGAAYRTGDTFQDQNCSTPATGHVVTVDSNGLILTYNLDTSGLGCVVGTGDTLTTAGTQPGIGSGASINITGITQGDGSVILTVPYTVQPVQ